MRRKRTVDKDDFIINGKAGEDSPGFELKRKASHLVVLIFPISIHCLHLKLWHIQLVLFIFVIIAFSFEFYRLRTNRNIFSSWGFKEKEKTKIANYPYMLAAWFLTFLSVGRYHLIIVELVIVSTHIGDGATAVIGKAIGKHHLILTKHKKWEGLFAGMIVTLLTGGIFLLAIGYTDKLYWVIIPGFVVGILDFFEDLPGWRADNVLNPLISLAILLILESF